MAGRRRGAGVDPGPVHRPGGPAGPGPGCDPDALRDQVHDELRRAPGWLLIFDNADQAGGIAPWLPSGPMPAGIPGHVITTTRRGGFAALGRVMDLDVIDLPHAVELLRSRVPDLGQDAREQIAEEFGRLPLALEQAAAFMDPGPDARRGVPWTCCAAAPPTCTRAASSRSAGVRGDTTDVVLLLNLVLSLRPETAAGHIACSVAPRPGVCRV